MTELNYQYNNERLSTCVFNAMSAQAMIHSNLMRRTNRYIAYRCAPDLQEMAAHYTEGGGRRQKGRQTL